MEGDDEARPPISSKPYILLQHDWHLSIRDAVRRYRKGKAAAGGSRAAASGTAKVEKDESDVKIVEPAGLKLQPPPEFITTVWVSAFREGEPCVESHGDFDVVFAGDDAPTKKASCYWKRTDETRFSATLQHFNQEQPERGPRVLVTSNELKYSSTIVAPDHAWDEVMKDLVVPAPKYQYDRQNVRAIYALDISPFVDLAVAGTTNGLMRVFSVKDGHIYKALRPHTNAQTGRKSSPMQTGGHVGDISVNKFFPSGKVILSGSSDRLLKIWAVEHAQCVKTFTGHQDRISQVCFLDKTGRRFVSASMDKTLRMWDCSGAEAVKIHGEKKDSLFGQIHDCEALEDGSCIMLADSLGKLSFLDLRSSNVDSSQISTDKLMAVAVSSIGHECFAGTDSGEILCLDRRKMSKYLFSVKKNNAEIRSILLVNDQALITTASDGSTTKWKIYGENADCNVIAEYVGPDCEPVNCSIIAASSENFGNGKSENTTLMTAAADGIVRKYTL